MIDPNQKLLFDGESDGVCIVTGNHDPDALLLIVAHLFQLVHPENASHRFIFDTMQIRNA